MSDPIPIKSDSDVSSNSSWEVINESDNSSHSSLDDLLDEKKLDNDNVTGEIYKDVNEDTFVTIPEVEADLEAQADTSGFHVSDESSEKENVHQKLKHAIKKKWFKTRGRRKTIPTSLSSLSIIVSVLTLTGLSFLCLLFPTTNESKPIAELQEAFSKLSNVHSQKFENDFNNTLEIFDLPRLEKNFMNYQHIMTDNSTFNEDELCAVEEELDNITKAYELPVSSMNKLTKNVMKSSKQSNNNDKTGQKTFSRRGVRNETISIIRDLKKNLWNPRLHILFCTIMKDLYILKLIKELDGNHILSEKSKDKIVKRIKKGSKKVEKINKIKQDITNRLKLKQKTLKKKAASTKIRKSEQPMTFNTSYSKLSFEYQQPSLAKADSEVEKQLNTKFDNENGKSECERRFQELDFRWESVGQNHRQKIQQIKEKFKHELNQVRENEKQLPVRKERMKLIREIYIQRLKNDRERYLYHLTKLRDERHKLMNDICRRKKAIKDSRDAAVGNYAILLPETYDFQQKLENMRNREYSKELHVSSFVTSSFPSLNVEKLKVFSGNESSPNILESDSTFFIPNQTRDNYHKERVHNYYESKSKYLRKKLKKDNTSKDLVGTENTTETDPLRYNITTVSTPVFENSVIENLEAENGEQSTSETEPLLEGRTHESNRKRKNKKEMYDLLFDENGERIKKAESTKQYKIKNQLPIPVISKQSSKTFPKKILLFKGRL